MFPLFVLTAVWVLLSAAVLVFHLKARADTKRRNHSIIVIGMCLIFLLFPLAATRGKVPASLYLYMVPFVAFIAFQWIFTTRFCDACNATVISKSLLTKPATCWKCGAALGPPPGAAGPTPPPAAP